MTTGFSFNNAMKKLTVSDIDTYLNKVKFGVKLVDTDFIKNDFIQIENVEKPLKAISEYKVNDLILICNKLEIDVKHALSEKTKTKKEPYIYLVRILKFEG